MIQTHVLEKQRGREKAPTTVDGAEGTLATAARVSVLLVNGRGGEPDSSVLTDNSEQEPWSSDKISYWISSQGT